MEREAVMFERRISTNDPGEGKPNPNVDDRTDRAGERQTIRYVLLGPKGAVQFVYWRTTGESAAFSAEMRTKYGPREGDVSDEDGGWLTAVDLGFHSRAPMKWQDRTESRECEYVGKCWYDGSGMHAAPVLTKLMRGGPEAVWRDLEDYYGRVFETPDDEKTINDVGFGQLLGALLGSEKEEFGD